MAIDNSDPGQWIFLGLLAGATAIWFWLNHRKSPQRGAQSIMGWALLFAGFLAAAGLWQQMQAALDFRSPEFTESGTIKIPRSYDGHYYLSLTINDANVRFMIDTGASGIVLTKKDAKRAGFDPDTHNFYDSANTANGVVALAPITLGQISVGPFSDRRVPAVINDGEMDTSLLGMDYLERFNRIEILRGTLTLER